MNTKEAIEFLEKKNISGDELLKMKIKNVKKLAKLLKRGEKFEKMWGEFKNSHGFKILYWAWKDMPKDVNEGMNKLEQKYFPKEESNVPK